MAIIPREAGSLLDQFDDSRFADPQDPVDLAEFLDDPRGFADRSLAGDHTDQLRPVLDDVAEDHLVDEEDGGDFDDDLFEDDF